MRLSNWSQANMSRLLNDLDPRFKPIAFELLARFTEAGLCVIIIDTLRTEAEQQANLARGVSWTPKSRHLVGLAIDVCPLLSYQLYGADKLQWQADDPVWQQMGVIGEAIGLRWGGRWTQKDMGHFEYVVPATLDLDV